MDLIRIIFDIGMRKWDELNILVTWSI